MFNQIMPLFENGTLKPLPHKTFPIESVENAFRYMAQAKHIGKVVVSHQDSDIGRGEIRADASYLITGGLAALGLQVAEWLVQKGTKHLVLVGRKASKEATQIQLSQLQAQGAEITVAQTDVSKSDEVAQLFKKIKDDLPPLRGLIHAAGVLDDGVLLQQNWERFTQVMSPKVSGAWNLHLYSQDLLLDFFVCFSSVASLLGSPGQGNYAAANSFLDALANYRQNLGLPSLTINWGPWGGAGMASELGDRFASQGMNLINPEDGLQVFEQLLQQDFAQVGVMSINWTQFPPVLPNSRNLSMIADLVKGNKSRQSTPEISKPDREFIQKLKQAQESDHYSLLASYIQQQTAQV